MAELNEEQLLLLNNLMYYSGSASTNTDVATIAQRAIAAASDPNTKSGTFSGGFENDPSKMIEIANAILADDQLRNLKVVDSINTDGVRASCFVDANQEATIAVRGTGGSYEAWSDNFDGANQMHTDCQEDFLEFFNEQAENFDNITVTGHSKGGNMAQYATILNGDKVDRCVSFDGQGFNDEFCKKYADQISENSDKIKSICGDEDYVNILLNDVAGETVYLKTTDGENAHSSHALWKENQYTMNEDGEFLNTVEQAETTKVLDEYADKLVDLINDCPDYFEKDAVDVIGTIAGLIFGLDSGQIELIDFITSLEDILSMIRTGVLSLLDPRVREFYKKLADLIADLITDYTEAANKEKAKSQEKKINVGATVNGSYMIEININNLSKFEKELNKCKSKLASLSLELWALNLGTNYPDDLDRTVRKIRNKLDDQKDAVAKLDNSLVKIINQYKTTETNISKAL